MGFLSDQVKVKFPNGMWSFLPEELHEKAVVNVDSQIVFYIERLEEARRQERAQLNTRLKLKNELTKSLDIVRDNQAYNMERAYTEARSELARKEVEQFKQRKRPLSPEEIKQRKRARERKEKEDAKEQWK